MPIIYRPLWFGALLFLFPLLSTDHCWVDRCFPWEVHSGFHAVSGRLSERGQSVSPGSRFGAGSPVG